ncbi:hypothetical protein O6H91_11G074800 [Diphasiastrum complanatum]|uniref:Uncharacterized protein n=1 Tax=Diphasiastrum complanatum TaxID=34168 RepID=A0ACC2CAM2_DIPCM|nr:hypothetical protein O6H91_11G074800 [Diphasiastrum complanatum]
MFRGVLQAHVFHGPSAVCQDFRLRALQQEKGKQLQGLALKDTRTACQLRVLSSQHLCPKSSPTQFHLVCAHPRKSEFTHGSLNQLFPAHESSSAASHEVSPHLQPSPR